MRESASIDFPENAAKALGDRTLSDMKTPALRAAHSESTSTAISHSVEKRQKQVSPAYHRFGQIPRSGARLIAWLARASRVRAQHLNSGKALGLVAGAYAELSRRLMRAARRHVHSC